MAHKPTYEQLEQEIKELEKEAVERKRAEEATKLAYAELSQIFNTAADGMRVIDKGFNVLKTNHTFSTLSGVSESESVGRKCYEVFSGPTCHTPGCFLVRVIGGENRVESEVEKERSDGTKVPCIVVATPFREPGGELIGIVEDFEDITERKRAEEALRKSEERYQRTTGAVTDYIFTVRVESGHPVETIHGPACASVTGYSAEEFASDPYLWIRMVHEADQAVVREQGRRVLSGQEVQPIEHRIFRKDGVMCWVKNTLVPHCDPQGNLLSYDGLIRDITERKRAEEALKEYSEKLEEMVKERTKDLQEAQEQLVRREKLAVLGQLAGGIGHELRNPLGAIKNAAYFLNMAIEEPEAEVKETLKILENEVATCERTISSLLDFARPKPLARQKVKVNEVIREVLSRSAVPDNVEVLSEIDESLPAILADPDQLAQVFGNIVLNAIQAMSTWADGAADRPDGGRLVVKTSASSVEPSEAPGPGWVTVSFTDTGAGIGEQELGKVFEPLFTTKAGGIGLGLAVSKMLVEGHGGSIQVESQVGKGSTITVRLPIKD